MTCPGKVSCYHVSLYAGIITLLLALSAATHAGVISPCSDPTVLPGPKVHVFVFPYQAESKLTARGRELATIIQRHVLFAALKYSSIAIVELTADQADCTFERVSARVNERLKDGQAAIYLWGRLFEQGNAIYLQSTAAFTMHGAADAIQWKLGSEATDKAQATIPSDPVPFAARRIPLEFLQMLEPAQREARRLHSEPNTSSSYFDLPSDPEARFGYEVMEARDGWMHVRIFPGGDQGWIPAHALVSGDDLKGSFPELYFIDGLIGYHELWGMPSRPTINNSRTLNATLASFDRYISQSAGRSESDARALAAVLKGNATLRATGNTGWSVESLQSAQRSYIEARRLAPISTVADNFSLACASALCARGVCEDTPDELHQQYLNAISRDPTNAELVSNLSAFYGAAQNGSINVSTPREEIAKQKVLTDHVKSEMR